LSKYQYETLNGSLIINKILKSETMVAGRIYHPTWIDAHRWLVKLNLKQHEELTKQVLALCKTTKELTKMREEYLKSLKTN